MSKLSNKENGIINWTDMKKPSVKLLYFLLLVFCLIAVLSAIAPPIWIFLSGFKDIKEFTIGTNFLPTKFNFGVFAQTWHDLEFFRFYVNSFIVVAGSIACAVVFNGLLAFAISILKPKGSKFIYMLVLGSLMVPATTSMVPLFININNFHMMGTFYPLWLVAGANAFFVILFKQFFDTIPMSIVEAARIDGCKDFNIFIKIVLPLCKPIIMVVSMYAITYAWSDFLLPYLVLNGTPHETVMVRLFEFNNGTTSDVDIIRAIVFAIIPPVLLFTVFQKRITQGSAFSGIKG